MWAAVYKNKIIEICDKKSDVGWYGGAQIVPIEVSFTKLPIK